LRQIRHISFQLIPRKMLHTLMPFQGPFFLFFASIFMRQEEDGKDDLREFCCCFSYSCLVDRWYQISSFKIPFPRILFLFLLPLVLTLLMHTFSITRILVLHHIFASLILATWRY
jgi:hypothetical protein